VGVVGAGDGLLNELTRASRLGRVRATAYSKLTLSLRVVGRRDDGYHELEAFAVSVEDPHDVVEVEAVPHPGGITFDLTGETDSVPVGPDNLAVRAGEALMLRAGRSGHGVRMTLRKKIPAGAGLGGGSADAAAAIAAIQRLLEVEIDEAGMREVGASVGSDVPFCLSGGAAWMRGRGELLEPVALPAGLGVLVAIPPFQLSTPAVYRAWDELGGPEATRVIDAPDEIAQLTPTLANDLEPAAESIEPGLKEFRAALEETVGVPAILAGSGAAYAVLPGGSHDRVTSLARRVRRALKVPVAASQSVSRGVRLGSG
jgi:4-diphosphocytidyl-2-C-methyl-D-erythritol kinase